jgi:hypothetical protein
MNIRGNWTQEVQYLRDAGHQFLIEPAITLRVGGIEVPTAGGRSHNLTNASFKQSRDILSLGMVYQFGKN